MATIYPFYIRWGRHFKDAFVRNVDYLFYRAVRKYGWENFNKYILYQTKSFKKIVGNKCVLKHILNIREKQYIKKYRLIMKTMVIIQLLEELQFLKYLNLQPILQVKNALLKSYNILKMEHLLNHDHQKEAHLYI